MKFTTNYDEFISWHDKFLGQHKSNGYFDKHQLEYQINSYTPNYRPKDIKAWIERVDQTHQEIRELLGGFDKTFTIESGGEEKPVQFASASKIIKAIEALIPNYYNVYQFNYQVFLLSKLYHKDKEYSTAKHVLGYAKRARLDPEKTIQLSNLLGELGVLWAASKARKKQVTIYISTHPKHFALIGNYPICQISGSCFAQTGMNVDKKFAVGAKDNTFVCLVKNNSSNGNWDEHDKAITIRFFGTINPDHSIINFCNQNGYFKDDYHGHISILQELTKQLLGFAEPQYIRSNVRHKGGLNYGHGDSFFDGKKHQNIEPQVIDFPIDYSVESHNTKDGYANWPAEIVKEVADKYQQNSERYNKRYEKELANAL
jgi:hypothetical protein